MLDQWVYQPGLPDNAARPDPGRLRRASTRRLQRLQRRRRRPPLCLMPAGTGPSGCASSRRLPRAAAARRGSPSSTGPSASRQSGNSEVLFAWLRLALANRYEPAVPAAERFLMTMGRRKFVAPLFETLIEPGRMGPADRRAALCPRPRPAIIMSPPARWTGCSARLTRLKTRGFGVFAVARAAVYRYRAET